MVLYYIVGQRLKYILTIKTLLIKNLYRWITKMEPYT